VLLRANYRSPDPKILDMAVLTLDKMAAGGIYDQIGGGFHRYSTDARWQVPHFEKTLYDTARLVNVYLDAWQMTHENRFLRIVTNDLEFVTRELTAPGGGFYSALDADSPGTDGRSVEGLYYTWTPEELGTVLSDDALKLISTHYGITLAGNFDGRNIVRVVKSIDTLATDNGIEQGKTQEIIDRARRQLRSARDDRTAPLRDEKILAAWNGLMISAFARAGLLLNEPEYLQRAAAAANFILTQQFIDDRLRRSNIDGEVSEFGYLEDYAFMISGLLDLYEATGRLDWFRHAADLDRILEQKFEDTKNGAFFRVGDDHEKLLAREKPSRDGVVPSGNSVSIDNLLRFYEFTTDTHYRERAMSALRFFGSTLNQSPTVLNEMLLSADRVNHPSKQIVIVSPQTNTDAQPFLDQFANTYLPGHTLMLAVNGDDVARQAELLPVLEQKRSMRGKATAYVCEQWVCDLPTTDPAQFARLLRSAPKSPPEPALRESLNPVLN
jgi:uncharacterized protein YyaL (SSP411 family)